MTPLYEKLLRLASLLSVLSINNNDCENASSFEDVNLFYVLLVARIVKLGIFS